MIWKNYLILLSVFCFNSCISPNRDVAQDFIKKYGDSDFNEFKNYSVFVRSYEERGKNVCVMVMHDNDTGYCTLHLAFIIQKSTLNIIETKINETENQQCKLDTVVARKLAIELLKMKIHAIGIDSNDNVFVNVKFNEEQTAELIKFSDEKFITGTYKKNYRPVGGNWYERTE